MKMRKTMYGLLAAGLSVLSANACLVQIRVACADDKSAPGVRVWMDGPGDAYTDQFGIATFNVNFFGTYNVCVDTTTLPAGAKLAPTCMKVKVQDDAPPVFNFVLSGAFCTPPGPGPCWMTGGGQIGKGATGPGNYSFGGVVYPGCSPLAAGGGNWNVIDHASGLHFQGQDIVVDSCGGVPTSSPKVNVNVIDFHGTGIISGIGGNPDATAPVSFVGRAVDNHDGGAGADLLYIQVLDASNAVVLQVGNSAADPAVISTGNLQIHTTGCNK
jgi:hypothetical protein